MYSDGATAALAGLSGLLLGGLGLLQRADVQPYLALHRPPPGPDRLESVTGLSPPELPANHPVRERLGTTFTGPALIVPPEGRLFGSPSTGKSPAPFSDALYRAMGEPSDDPGAPGAALLLSDRRLTTEALFSALSPLLSRRQTTYRWVIGARPSTEGGAQLGFYGDLLASDGFRATVGVEILPRVEVLPPVPEGPPVRGPRFALVVRVDQSGAPVLVVSGRLGQYRPIREREPFLASELAPGSGRVSLVDVLWAVREVVLVVPGHFDVDGLTRVMLAVLRGVRTGRGESHVPTFAITTDTASLGTLGRFL